MLRPRTDKQERKEKMAVYLYYGEETYLLENKVRKIKKDFGELVQGINYIQIDDTNVEQLISDLETPA